MNWIYGLFYDSGLNRIGIRVHQDLVKWTVITRKMCIFTDQTNTHPELLKLNFCGDLARASWGFRSAFRKFREGTDHSGFLITLPGKQLKTCYFCNGTGQNAFKETCIRCRGKKHIFSSDWQSLIPVLASLSIFFRLAEAFIAEGNTTTNPKKQLIIVSTHTNPIKTTSSNGWAVRADLSKALFEWVLANEKSTMREVVKDMKSAYAHSITPDKLPGFCSAYIHDESITFEIGQAIICQNRSVLAQSELGGQTMTCDNMDGSTSQLIGLVALASICGQAKTAGVGG